MKALRLFIISLLVITNATFAQSNTTSEKPASDFLMIQLGVDGWAGKPDSLKTTGIGRALNIYVCKNYPLKNSKLSFAVGAGIGSSNIFLDNLKRFYNKFGIFNKSKDVLSLLSKRSSLNDFLLLSSNLNSK